MEMPINPAKPTVMHIDLNSCFATIEQQANPFLRGKPLVVAAYTTPSACVLAPSIEAKRFGVKTGMRVRDARALCPSVLVLMPDPPKYRYVYNKFCALFSEYTPNMHPKSIDEAVLHFEGTPALKRKSMEAIGLEIKLRMRQEIGDWLSCNVGIATNAFLAKLAASLHKPDGLDIITKDNLLDILKPLRLEDLCGISRHNKARLFCGGIYTPVDFHHASLQQLRAVFASINGYYWYLRLRGWEIDNVVFQRKTIGHSYALPQASSDLGYLSKLLYKLCEKMGRRLRQNNYGAQGMHIGCSYKDGTYWHHGHKMQKRLYTTKELFLEAKKILVMQPESKLVRNLFVTSFALFPWHPEQLSLLEELDHDQRITKALDTINDRWGEFTVAPAIMMHMDKIILDRIAFGSTRDYIPPVST